MTTSRYAPAVRWWLAAGLFMIFVQVVVGGITRLTGSGLSITRWEIVTGTFPPTSAEAWEEAFALYKATPQYQKINEGMSMGAFKFIYFWEYIHRLWARLMGFAFLLPLLYFYARGMLDGTLLRRLGIVFALACLVASFGWIMVASGLTDRPWVNAYKLTIHLSLALCLFGYLLWTTLKATLPQPRVIHNNLLKRGSLLLLIVLSLQIVLGGIMSGMKAALFFPTWPEMNGSWVPAVLLDPAQWTVDNLIHYDASPFMSALVQISHRTVGYLLAIMVLYYVYQALKRQRSGLFRAGLYLLITLLITQVSLGILTLTHSVGSVPVGLGVAHQAVALLLLANVLFIRYLSVSGVEPQPVENAVENQDIPLVAEP